MLQIESSPDWFSWLEIARAIERIVGLGGRRHGAKPLILIYTLWMQRVHATEDQQNTRREPLNSNKHTQILLQVIQVIQDMQQRCEINDSCSHKNCKRCFTPVAAH